MNTLSNTWSSIDPYPYDLESIIYYFSLFFILVFIPVEATSYIYRAPIVFIHGAFYVIGGYGAKNQNVIGKLDATTKIWSKSGELVQGRLGHNAIYEGSSILVVGGFYTHKTEKCIFSNAQITCSEQDPELHEYYAYPELVLVPNNFCETSI